MKLFSVKLHLSKLHGLYAFTLRYFNNLYVSRLLALLLCISLYPWFYASSFLCHPVPGLPLGLLLTGLYSVTIVIVTSGVLRFTCDFTVASQSRVFSNPYFSTSSIPHRVFPSDLWFFVLHFMKPHRFCGISIVLLLDILST